MADPNLTKQAVLHPAAHAARRCCLDNEGNAYGEGKTEPWGVIPLTASVKGIRYSFSITPVVYHKDTIPYQKRLEETPSSGSSTDGDIWPIDIPATQTTEGEYTRSTVPGSSNPRTLEATRYLGRDDNNRLVIYTKFNEYTDGGVTYNVKTWSHAEANNYTYIWQSRTENGTTIEEKYRVNDDTGSQDTNWEERPKDNTIASYSEIYEEQPNNIRWWFELNNIKKSFSEFVSWSKTAQESRDLAEEVLGDDLEDAVNSFLNDVNNSEAAGPPAGMSQAEFEEQIAEIRAAMGDTLDTFKDNISDYLTILDQSENKLNIETNITESTPAIGGVDYVRDGVA